MIDYGLPALFAVFVWWFATGAILWLVRRPRPTHRFGMAAVSVVSCAAAVALWRSADDASVAGACVAFGAAVLLWAWLETSFLMGYVTGPRRAPCPAGQAGAGSRGGWPHFLQATQTVIHHELAIAAAGLSVFVTTLDAVNPVGWWTFAVLWTMRLSAKLNLFLGVPNVNGELLPTHLQYLRGYLTVRPMNALFPWSVAASGAAAVWMAFELAVAARGSAAAVGLTLVLALLLLAILEHAFMVLRLPANDLWRWALASDDEAGNKPRPTLPLAAAAAVPPAIGLPATGSRSASR